MLQFCFYWPSWKRAFGELQAFVYVFVKKTDVITRVRELSPRQYCQRYASFFFLSNLIHVMSWVSSCIFLVLCLCLIIVRTLVSCVVFFTATCLFNTRTSKPCAAAFFCRFWLPDSCLKGSKSVGDTNFVFWDTFLSWFSCFSWCCPARYTGIHDCVLHFVLIWGFFVFNCPRIISG